MLVIPVTSIGVLAYQKLSENTFEASLQQTNTILDEVLLDIDLFEQTTLSNLELFSNDALLHKYVTADEDYRYNLILPTLLKLFGSYQKAYPEYYEIRVIMPDGFEDARKVNRKIDNITEQETDTVVGRQILSVKQKPGSFFAINPDNTQLSFYASKPIIITNRGVDSLTAAPKLRGFLSITVSADWLSNKISNINIGNSGFLFVTNSDGNIMFINSKQKIISQNKNIIQQLDSTTPAFGIKINEADNTINNQKLKLNNTTGYLWSTSITGDLQLFAWLPDKEIKDASKQLGIKILLISIISIFAMSFLVFNLLNYLIVKPIRKLEKSTRAIGRGDLIGSIKINSNDEIGSLARSFNNMSEDLLRSTEQIKYLAYHDELTGLPNRTMFLEYVSQAIAQAKRHNHRLGILYLDLDNFKRVNDTLGHKAGDLLLKEVSDRIHTCLRDTDYAARKDGEMTDIAARIGGDEFLLLLHNIPDNFLPGKVATRIINSLSETISIYNNDFHIGVSIGITVYPEDSTTADDLIKHADIAMYHAKSVGKNNYQYFLASMNESMQKRMQLENKLRTAIFENKIQLNYQPQIDAISGDIYGVEALARWNDPEEGMIPPDVFIPIAEDSGLIIELGEFVLRQACQQARDWQSLNVNPITVSVNVSAIQFHKVDLPELISNVLTETGLDAQYLDIEITESVIMEDLDRMSRILNQIRKLGCAISLDDFGTGYSSLNYLRQFPIDILKIDRSFVDEIDANDSDKSAIIIAIIAMSHALNLKVIAEGIETRLQFEKLIDWQCDYIQGFYLHRPLNLEGINKLLTTQKVRLKENA